MTMTTHTRKWVLYPVLAAALSSLVMGGVAIEYANYVATRNQRQWCEIVVTLDDANKTNPPTDPISRHLAEEFSRIRNDFGCRKG